MAIVRVVFVSRKAAKSQRADYQHGNYLACILQVFDCMYVINS